MIESAQHEKRWSRAGRMARLVWEIGQQTLDGFSKDRGELVAAALAYYTLLSIAPLVIVAVAIAGMVLGRGAAQQEVGRLLTDTMGSAAASAVQGWVDQAAANGAVASVVGLALVLLGASRLGGQLRNALNQIWNVDVTGPKGFRLVVADYCKKRAFSFLVVMASGPALLVVFVSHALLTGFHDFLFAQSPWSAVIARATQLLLSVSIVATLCAGVFRFVPDLRVSWRSALWGGLLTSVLFNVGNLLVGIYLARASVGAAYGAAGSAVVVLLWLQFSAYMFLIGAEFTQRLHLLFGPDVSKRPLQQPARELSAGVSSGAATAGGELLGRS